MSTFATRAPLHEYANVDGLRRLNQTFLGNLVVSPHQDTQFRTLFLKCDRDGFGTLDGDTARLLFRTAGLPDTTLYDIWSLADVEDRGKLDYRGFCLCCVLIAYCSMYPEVLRDPDWLWNPQLIHQLFSNGVLAKCIPAFDTSVLDAKGHTDPFSVTQAELNDYYELFMSIDRDGDGFLEGHDVRKYYEMRNELSDEDLLQIWELADADGDGRLSIPEFAVMEHLAKVRLTYAVPIPTRLPNELERLLIYPNRGEDVKVNTDRPGLPRLVREDFGVSTTSTTRRDTRIPKGLANGASSVVPSTHNSDDVKGVSTDRIPPTSKFTEPSIADANVASSSNILLENRRMREHIESLKKHVHELQSDMEKMEHENAYLKSLYQVKEERMSQLHAMHSAYSADAETERAHLHAEERELSELQDRIKTMHREKKRLESEKQTLREALMHSEDATQTMMRSLRNEHNKVGAIRNDRLHTMRKKIEILQSMHSAGDDVLTAHESAATAASGIRAITDVNLLHDSKGIRVAAAEGVMERRINPLTSSYQHADWSQKEGEGFPE